MAGIAVKAYYNGLILTAERKNAFLMEICVTRARCWVVCLNSKLIRKVVNNELRLLSL